MNRLPADDSYEIWSLTWFLKAGGKFEKCRLLQIVVAIFRVKIICYSVVRISDPV